MDLIAVFVGLVTVVVNLSITCLALHVVASGLIYGKQSWKTAAKITGVGFLYNILVAFSALTIIFMFSPIDESIAVMLGGITVLLVQILVFWEMIKYTTKAYDTDIIIGAGIYLIAGGLGYLVSAVISSIGGLI